MSFSRKLKISAYLFLQAVLMTAFFSRAYAEPQEGFVQEDAKGPESEALWVTDQGVSVELDGTGPVTTPAGEFVTGVQMSFSYGFRNIAKSGRRLPFEVRIENHEAEDFEGSLVLEVPGSTENGSGVFEAAVIRYTWPVAAAAGETVDAIGPSAALEEGIGKEPGKLLHRSSKKE